MNEVTNEVKQAILRDKIASWRNTYYSLEVDAKVAQDIGGMDDVLTAASLNMANAQRAIAALEKMLAEMPEQDGDS